MTTDAPLILIVDDEPNLCNIVQRILERENYRVMVAYEGIKVLEIIREFQPDMVVLDLMLPGIKGEELCQKIREISFCRIVYFSARVDLKLTGQLKEINKGIDGFIEKPASMKKIVSVVGNTLAKHELP